MGRIVLEKLLVAQVKKHRFITTFTRARHCFLSWTSWIHACPRNPF